MFSHWLLLMEISTFATVFKVLAEDDLSSCRQDLGMNSGAIPDSAITGSSAYDQKSVGPLNARIRTEKNGGAWCPKQQIGKDANEWLQIDFGDLRVVTMVETQGRFGNGQGQEFAPNYMLEYQREDGERWIRYRDLKGVEMFKGNVNTFLAELRELHPLLIARRLRFVPYASHPRTVCMRVELYGCPWPDGTVAYSMRQGDRRGTEMDFYDFTYDGSVIDGYLSGGLGQLTDLDEGNWNFRLDLQNLGKKGYEWLAWKSDQLTGSVEIVFKFDAVRNFSAALITANNFYTREVSVFQEAHVYFSVGGVHYSPEYIAFEYLKDSVLEYARQVVIPLEHRVGRFVKLVLFFDTKWMMISEIRFNGEKVTGSVPVEIPLPSDVVRKAGSRQSDQTTSLGTLKSGTMPVTTIQYVQSDAAGAPLATLDSVRDVDPPPPPQRQRLNDTTIGIIIGTLAAFIVLIVAVGLVVLLRHRRSKFSANARKSKCAYAADHIHFNLSDMTTTSNISTRKMAASNGSAGYCAVADGTESEKELALYQSNGHAIRSDASSAGEGLTYQRKLEKSNSSMQAGVPPIHVMTPPYRRPSYTDHFLGDKTTMSLMSDNNHLSALVVSIPEQPIFQHPIVPPSSNTHRGAVHPMSRFPESIESTTLRGKPHGNREPKLHRLTRGRPTSPPEADISTLPTDPNSYNAISQSTSHLKIPEKNLTFLLKLGDGVFGEVQLSELKSSEYGLRGGESCKKESRPKLVAVKVLQSHLPQIRNEFFRELDLMLTLDDPNIAQVLGVCEVEDRPAVVIEYLRGNLNQYLLRAIPDTTPITNNQSQSQTLSYGCLIYMATQIVSGMKFLETLNLVHRDLATRNCLIGHQFTVKISDLGISHSLYSSDYYKVDGMASLPIRWMSWEAIILNSFSCKSDIWSFAVTLWEILTFAREQPFSELSNEEVLGQCSHRYSNSSEQVVCLPQPSNCPKEIFDLMMECWNRDEAQRPSFREIHMFLQRKNMGYNPDDEHRISPEYRCNEMES